MTYTVLVERGRKDRCERCAGTGRFVTGTLNGVPAGPGGECFRCHGKGYQTAEDERRNTGYDRYAVSRAIREY